MKKAATLFFSCIAIIMLGQTPPAAYNIFIQKADSLYKAQKYKSAALAYSSAFQAYGWKGLVPDRYNAAKAWAQSSVPDSAFDCLNRIIKKRYFTNYDSLTAEKDFASLYTDARWQKLNELIKWYTNHKVPEGWFIAGTPDDRDKYLIGTEIGEGQDGKTAATIKAVDKGIKGFGNLMQNVEPGKYLGKRVRMSGYMKSKDADWASFWMRVDQKGSSKPLAFDNMIDGKENRSVKGT